MSKQEEKSILLKWLEGKLDDKEKKTIETLPNIGQLSKAIDMVDRLEIPEPDLVNMKNKLDEKRRSRQSIIRRLALPLGAIAAVLIGLVYWFSLSIGATILQTNPQQQQSITLPDQSALVLNAASKASYSEENWIENRQVKLAGSAYFKVKKGSFFSVQTEFGEVEVLGTQFEVLARDELFEVLCFEGKVRLASIDFDTIIVAGQGFINQAGKQLLFDVAENQPSWMQGELIFRDKQLTFVYDELERQYDVNIDYSSIRKTKRFKGILPLNNLEVSLKIVTIAMGHGFSISSNGKDVIISK